MPQVIRWYLCPLVVGIDGRPQVPRPISVVLSGRWMNFFLPGAQWALSRVRGDSAQHDALALRTDIFAWPRGRSARWAAVAPAALKTRLAALGFTVAGNPWPDEALDQLGQFYRDVVVAGGWLWDRAAMTQPDEGPLGAVEEV